MGVSRFYLRGEFDLATVPAMRERLRRLIDSSPDDLIVDCYDLTFLDAAAIKVMVEVQQTLSEQHRTIQLANVHPFIARLLRLCELYDVLGVSPVADPLASLQQL